MPWNVVVHNDPINLMSYIDDECFSAFLVMRKKRAEKHMLEVSSQRAFHFVEQDAWRAELYVHHLHRYLLLATVEHLLMEICRQEDAFEIRELDPFWQNYYRQIPDDTQPEGFTSGEKKPSLSSAAAPEEKIFVCGVEATLPNCAAFPIGRGNSPARSATITLHR